MEEYEVYEKAIRALDRLKRRAVEAYRNSMLGRNKDFLTDKEFQTFSDYNAKLTKLEKKMFEEAVSLCNEAKSKVRSSTNNLDEFELELNITYFLNENDHKFDSYEDNIIAEEKYILTGWKIENKHSMFNDNLDHNTFHNYTKDERVLNLKVCYLVHCLCEHHGIPIHEFNRIGEIWSEITIDYQYFSKLSD